MKNILIVDDDKQVAAVFQAALTATGKYQVVVANDGNGGLNTAREQKFDLVLLDEMMPDMSGNDVLRALKQNDATKAMPVAMLSNFGNNDMIKDALNSGAADYILKYQVSPTDLPEKIKELIGE